MTSSRGPISGSSRLRATGFLSNCQCGSEPLATLCRTQDFRSHYHSTNWPVKKKLKIRAKTCEGVSYYTQVLNLRFEDDPLKRRLIENV